MPLECTQNISFAFPIIENEFTINQRRRIYISPCSPTSNWTEYMENHKKQLRCDPIIAYRGSLKFSTNARNVTALYNMVI